MCLACFRLHVCFLNLSLCFFCLELTGCVRFDAFFRLVLLFAGCLNSF